MKDNKNVALSPARSQWEIRKSILLLILPIVLESFLQVFSGTISTAMIGRLEILDISAQGVCGKVTDTLYYFFNGIGVGLTVVIAKSFARKKPDECRTAFENTLLTMCALIAAVCIMIELNPRLFVAAFTRGDAALAAASIPYLRIVTLSLPAWCLSRIAAAVYQGTGDTKTPLYIAVCFNLVNLVLCRVLIFGYGPVRAMGLCGAAVALAASKTVSAGIYLFLLYRREQGLFRRLGCSGRTALGWDRRLLREVYTTGLPAAGESVNWQITSILLSIIIIGYGNTCFSAYQLGLQVEIVTEVPAVGFSVATAALISRALGLDNRELFEQYRKELLRLCTGISVVTSALLCLFPRATMGLLTDIDAVIEAGVVYVFLMGLIQTPQNLLKINAGLFRACGMKNTPMVVSLACVWGIRMPAAFVAGVLLKAPLTAIWVIIMVDQTMKYLISTWILKKKKITENFEQYAKI